MALLDSRVFKDIDDRWRNPLDIDGRPHKYVTREGAAVVMIHDAEQLLALAKIELQRAINSPEPDVFRAALMPPHGQVRVPEVVAKSRKVAGTPGYDVRDSEGNCICFGGR